MITLYYFSYDLKSLSSFVISFLEDADFILLPVKVREKFEFAHLDRISFLEDADFPVKVREKIEFAQLDRTSLNWDT